MLGLRRKIFVLLVITGLLLVLGGCGGGKQPAAENDKPAPIKVGMMPITDNLPFWLAEQKGYFRDEGIEVELVPFPSALERDSAFAAGKIDAGIGDMLAVAAMNNGGTAVKAVSVGQGAVPGENRFAILSAPGSGIMSPEQLKNVPIALSLNTINEYITDNLLAAGGLKPEEIKKNNMVKLPIRLEALLNGNVQAATLPDPFATLAEIKGAHLVVDNTENTVAQTVVIVRRETLDANLAGVQKMMRAYARAVEDLQADPRQYDELIAEKARVPEEVLASQAHPLRLHFSAPRLPDKQGVEKTKALPCGMVLGREERFDRLAAPLVYLVYPVPKIVFLPVLMVLLGIGDISKIALITLVIFFQILVPVRDAARGINAGVINSVKSLGAGRWDIYKHVVWPAVLPEVLTALRVASGTAIAVLFFSETIVSQEGLGYYLLDAWSRYAYREMFAGIIAMGLLGFIIYMALDCLERKLCPWKFL